MAEEKLHKIEELKARLALIKRLEKRIIDVELPDARSEYYAAYYERERLLKIPDEDLTDLDRRLLKKLVKEVPELRKRYYGLREELDRYITRHNKLEEELEELEWVVFPVPEYISIDQPTGYYIYYSKVKKKYFLVSPQEYEESRGNIVE